MTQSQTNQETIVRLKPPSMYKVILLNDDYTPMEFVVRVLIELFDKSAAESAIITQKVHNEGKGVCGVYTREIAETKVDEVGRAARKFGYPLKATMEKE